MRDRENVGEKGKVRFTKYHAAHGERHQAVQCVQSHMEARFAAPEEQSGRWERMQHPEHMKA